MSNFEDTTDDIEDNFLANLEEVSLLVGLEIETGNLIEENHYEINRRRLISLKKTLQNNNLMTQSTKPVLGKPTCTRPKQEAGHK